MEKKPPAATVPRQAILKPASRKANSKKTKRVQLHLLLQEELLIKAITKLVALTLTTQWITEREIPVGVAAKKIERMIGRVQVQVIEWTVTVTVIVTVPTIKGGS